MLPLEGRPLSPNGDVVIGVITRHHVLREEYDLEVYVCIDPGPQISPPRPLCNNNNSLSLFSTLPQQRPGKTGRRPQLIDSDIIDKSAPH